jgi:hypothetical protein
VAGDFLEKSSCTVCLIMFINYERLLMVISDPLSINEGRRNYFQSIGW